MRGWMLVGGLWLGLGAVACGHSRAQQAPVGEEPGAASVGASAGGGGGATVDTGQEPASLGEVGTNGREQLALYEQVARELGVERRSADPRPTRLEGEGVGGAGAAGGEQRACAQTLTAREPTTVVTGVLGFTSEGLVTVEVPGRGTVQLLTDAGTCAVRAGRALSPESLAEGTEARVAYVEEGGGATARVIRAEPQRESY